MRFPEESFDQIQLHLCLDIGNTQLKAGLRQPGARPGNWEQIFRRKGISAEWLQGLLSNYRVDAAVVSATRAYDEAFRKILQELPVFLELDHQTPLPIHNYYKTPKTLGRDRLAAVCGARAIYPGEECLVIDAGTCITMDRIDRQGGYHGGSIHPGLTMRFRALHRYTGRLPLVKGRKAGTLFGASTEDSILSGVAFAASRELDGMIGEYQKQFGELKVIITGGDAAFFVTQLKSEIFAHANLVLSGLGQILDYNA